jgi:hypothetical protein
MVVDLNPARIEAREVVHMRSILIMEYTNRLSIESESIPSPNHNSLERKGSRTTVRLLLTI